MSVRGVFFDVGETLVDEERIWGEVARAVVFLLQSGRKAAIPGLVVLADDAPIAVRERDRHIPAGIAAMVVVVLAAVVRMSPCIGPAMISFW